MNLVGLENRSFGVDPSANAVPSRKRPPRRKSASSPAVDGYARADVPTTAPDIATASIVNLVNAAKTTLSMSLTSVSPEVKQALIAAVERDVDVQFYLQTHKGNNPESRNLREMLATINVDCIIDNQTRIPSNTVMVDGERGFANGTTLDAKAAKELMATFRQLFDTQPDPAGFGVKDGDVKIFTEPEVGAAKFIGELDNAKETIDISIYLLDYPGVIDALKRAAARHVKVRVMLEPKPVGGSNAKYVMPLLTKAGIDAKDTPPQFDSNRNVDHAKVAIVDRKTVMLSTGNFRRSSLGGHPALDANNRDFLVVDRRRETLQEAQQLYDADWNRTPSTGIKFATLVVTPDNAKQRVLDFIGRQKKRLYFYNQSLNEPDVLAALIAAKKKGVDVRVLLSYRPGSANAPSTNQKSIDALKAAGVKAGYMTAFYLHAKAMVGDNEVYAGSQNFNPGGLGRNRDLGEIIPGPETCDMMSKLFLDDEATAEKSPVPKDGGGGVEGLVAEDPVDAYETGDID